ncbi:MAG: 2Fe-2S iron-sulfur cluster-binding protein [Lentisphaeria bacterium]
MSYKIIVNHLKNVYIGKSGESLFAALTRNGVFIPTACGGRGKCGFCKVSVLSGIHQDFTDSEKKLLKPDELASGIRLSCQVLPEDEQTIEIEVPESYFSVGRYQVKLMSKTVLTPDILLVKVQAVEPRFIRVVAGSWMAWQIPAYGGISEPFQRSFSVASDPANRRNLEFIIRRTPCGPGTTWIFDVAKVGDMIELVGPQGKFRLQDNPREAIFVAGGSGLSAIRSLLLDMKTRKVNKKSRLFFGAVNRTNLYLTDELSALEESLPDFKFVPVLSAEDPEDHWDGEKGLVTSVFAKYYKDCSEMEAYLCGSPGMLHASIKVLKELGMKEENIRYDEFV